MNTNRLIVYLGVALLAGGCKREEGVHAYDAPKDPPPGVVVASKNIPSEDGNADVGGGKIHWVVSPAWKEVAAPQMTQAAYQVSENPPVLLTVSRIAARGSEEETALANLNRWEGQLKLPPTSQANMDKVAMPIKIAGHNARLINLSSPTTSTSPRQQMLAALVPDGDSAWAFKIMGPPDVVTPQAKAFAEVVMSVHFDGAGEASPEKSAASDGSHEGSKIPGIASFTLPPGWTIDTQPHSMRAATIIVKSGNQQAEVIVSKLNSASLNDLVSNLVRWRGMVGLPPTTDVNSNPPQDITLAQGPAVIRDFDGPESAGAARMRQFVAYTQFPGAPDIWFFKFIGPHDLVSTSKPAFEAFVKSLKFDTK